MCFYYVNGHRFGQQRGSSMIIVCIWEVICIDLSFFSSLSFFLFSFSSFFFFLFSVCTTHTLTLWINVQKNDEYVTTAFIWLLLARFFSSSSSLFDIFSFSSACCCYSCLIDIICCLRREERILLLVRSTALFIFCSLSTLDCRCC